VRADIQLVKGKTSPILKSVDQSAKAAARQPWKTDRGFRGGKVARSKLKGASTLYPADGGTPIIRIYRSRHMRRGEQKIYFEVFSESSCRYEAKHHAFAMSPLADELHRSHVYRVRFNGDSQYAIIEAIVESDVAVNDAPQAVAADSGSA
jgi:hypothetical protein